MAEDPNQIEDPNESEGIRSLRQANERLKADADAGRVAQRKLAFIEAGLDITNPQHKLLMKSYDGELTSEAIQAEAKEYGLISDTAPPAAPAAPAAPTTPATDVSGMANAQRGLQTDSFDPAAEPPPPEVLEAAYADFHEARRTGATAQEASAAIFGRIFEAAREGNPDFVYDAAAWQQDPAARQR